MKPKVHPLTFLNRARRCQRAGKLPVSADQINRAFALAFGSEAWRLWQDGEAWRCYGSPDGAGWRPTYTPTTEGCTCRAARVGGRYCYHRLALWMRLIQAHDAAAARVAQERANAAAHDSAVTDLYGPA